MKIDQFLSFLGTTFVCITFVPQKSNAVDTTHHKRNAYQKQRGTTNLGHNNFHQKSSTSLTNAIRDGEHFNSSFSPSLVKIRSPQIETEYTNIYPEVSSRNLSSVYLPISPTSTLSTPTYTLISSKQRPQNPQPFLPFPPDQSQISSTSQLSSRFPFSQYPPPSRSIPIQNSQVPSQQFQIPNPQLPDFRQQEPQIISRFSSQLSKLKIVSPSTTSSSSSSPPISPSSLPPSFQLQDLLPLLSLLNQYSQQSSSVSSKLSEQPPSQSPPTTPSSQTSLPPPLRGQDLQLLLSTLNRYLQATSPVSSKPSEQPPSQSPPTTPSSQQSTLPSSFQRQDLQSLLSILNRYLQATSPVSSKPSEQPPSQSPPTTPSSQQSTLPSSFQRQDLQSVLSILNRYLQATSPDSLQPSEQLPSQSRPLFPSSAYNSSSSRLTPSLGNKTKNTNGLITTAPEGILKRLSNGDAIPNLVLPQPLIVPSSAKGPLETTRINVDINNNVLIDLDSQEDDIQVTQGRRNKQKTKFKSSNGRRVNKVDNKDKNANVSQNENNIQTTNSTSTTINEMINLQNKNANVTQINQNINKSNITINSNEARYANDGSRMQGGNISEDLIPGGENSNTITQSEQSMSSHTNDKKIVGKLAKDLLKILTDLLESDCDFSCTSKI